MKTADDFLRIEEACRLLGIGRTNVYYLLGARKLIGKKLGRLTLVTKQSVDSFLSSLPEAHISPQKKKEDIPAQILKEKPRAKQKLLGRRQVKKIVPVSEMTLWRWEREGLFPKHINVGKKSLWLASEINEWMQKHSETRTQKTSEKEEAHENQKGEHMQKPLSWEQGRRAGILEALSISTYIVGNSRLPEVRRGARIIASELEKILVSEERGDDEPAIRRRKDPAVARYRVTVSQARRRLSARRKRTYSASSPPSSGNGNDQPAVISWAKPGQS